MTQAAAYGIYDAINDFVAEYPAQTRVCVNDMSLPFGGKFDLNQNWDSPHYWHDRGKAVDVNTTASNQCPTQALGGIPHSLAAEFLQKCLDRNADEARSRIESNHVHCNWPDSFTPLGG
jgi:hypothetical protein